MRVYEQIYAHLYYIFFLVLFAEHSLCVSVYSFCLVLALVLFTLLSAPQQEPFYFLKAFTPAATPAPAKRA